MIIAGFCLLLGIGAGLWLAIYCDDAMPFFVCFLTGLLATLLSFGICMTYDAFIPEEEKVFELKGVEYPERIPGYEDESFYLFADVDDGDVAYGYLTDAEYELKPKTINAGKINLHSDSGTPRIEYFRQTGYTRWHRYIYAVPVSTVANVYLPDAKESVIWGSAH